MTQPNAAAIAAARAAQAKYKIPASIQIAQWALESAWGKRDMGVFNYFGMKALAGQPFVTVLTHEEYKGKPVEVHAAFRKFANPAEAFDAHAKLLATGAPYAAARAKLPDVFAFANQLGGGTPAHPRYATDPDYGSKIAAVIRDSNLTQYDR